jgi:hypothetical protein
MCHDFAMAMRFVVIPIFGRIAMCAIIHAQKEVEEVGVTV